VQQYDISNKRITKGEFAIAFPSAIIGVSVLELPSEIASVTSYSDGWIPILIGGIIFLLFALLAVHVAKSFPNDSFYTYTSRLLSKPVAGCIVFILIVIALFIGSYILRSVAFISQQYLFDKTPMEILALSFLLVVIYAISGERIGLFRLNILFFPIIIFIFIFVGIFIIEWFEYENFLPLLKTDVKGYVNGTVKTFGSYFGFSIGLFYIYLVKNKDNAYANVITGLSLSIIFYLYIFFICIAVFGNLATSNLHYPTIELAKRVSIPGGIFERVDAFVFSIWVMAIFNTISITLDIALNLLCSIFKKANKKIISFIFAPIIFYVSMFPESLDQLRQFSKYLGVISTSFHCSVILLLFAVMKVRGVPLREEN